MADDTYRVERSMTIEAPPTRVYEEIVDFHNWRKWSPWDGIDPQQQHTYSGAASGPGAVYTWSGNRRVGEGRMEITNAAEPSKVDVDLQFVKPWKARNDAAFTIEPAGTGSRVTWSVTGKKTFMTRVMGIVKSMDKMLGPDFEKGLTKLKAAAEAPVTET
jgi:uncharacterized protein YndB with AHSA1/START domain